MSIKIAIAHLADGRRDFFTRREALVCEELTKLDWLRQTAPFIESEVMTSVQEIEDFSKRALSFGAQALIIHIPIWADPVFSIKLNNYLPLPIALLGNDRPETSSIVGVLGAGGALDQIGCSHVRFFEHDSDEARRKIIAFVRAASARSQLRGQTLGLFGGRSLGIFTATADPAQWQRLFGVDIELLDQCAIVELANSLPEEEVQKHLDWLLAQVGGVEYGNLFNPLSLERQVRSYLATKKLLETHCFNFIGVKCQPEMSDGYVSQCVAHMLINGVWDAEGQKPSVVHACESDADGALTMQILHLISEGKPTALLDMRWYNQQNGVWTLANCGALSASFYADQQDPTGLSKVRIVPHVFGKGGGGALPAVVVAQEVTLARLCRRAGEYWMAVIAGQVEGRHNGELKRTTGVFPQAFVRSSAGLDFAKNFGSNHIHMVNGNYVEELRMFCRLIGIECEIW
ncbi:MAG: hypothetical protein HPY45_16790 [Anaerolineae bacterium]|nr:hypothetical protein [Anaerolineae bacterium]